MGAAFLKFFSLFLGFLSLPITASKVSISVENSLSNSYEALIHFKIPEGHKIYSPFNQIEQMRPVLRNTNLKNIDSFSLKWPEHHKTENGFSVYDSSFIVRLTFVPTNPQSSSQLQSQLDYIACSKGQCFPMSYALNFNEPKGLADPAFFKILIIAFLGGLILNVMPCVLPILSLKLFTLLHHRKREKIGFTLLGSLCFFTLFAVLISVLRSFGILLGWGMHFQNPYFTNFFFLLLLLLSARFLGVMQVKSPDVTIPLPLGERGRAFLEGFVMALLATPCSAPYLGLASGIALSLSFWPSLGVFWIIWIGFSTPYWIMLAFPKVLSKILPKPGKWMQKLEKFLGSIVLIFALFIGGYILRHQVDSWLPSLATLSTAIVCLIFMRLKPHLQKLFFFLCLLPLAIPLHHSNVPQKEVSMETFSKEAFRGKSSLIKIGAKWCLSCHLNDSVFQSKEVKAFLKSSQIKVVDLDFTMKDPAILQTIHSYNRSGIPFSVFFSPKHPHGKVLPEVLNVANLIDFLKKNT